MKPYNVSSEFSHTGVNSLEIQSNSTDDKYESIQLVYMEDVPHPSFLMLSGWSAARDVYSTGVSDGYSISMMLVYTDNSVHFSKKAQFREGTHNWQKSCVIMKPPKPLFGVAVFTNFRDCT